MKRYLLLVVMLLCTLRLAAQQSEVVVACDWGDIHGTLMAADGEGQSDMVALLIAGSGPTDRDCNSSVGLRTNAFAYLAKALSSMGVASYRYDKQGIGASPSPTSESDLRFSDYVADAAECVKHLTTMGFGRVVLIGHSEGALIALAVAARYEQLPIAGVVSLCGVGHTLDYMLKVQISHQLVSYDIGMMMSAMSLIDRIKSGERIADEQIPAVLRPLFRESVQGYLCSSMSEEYNPQRLIRDVEVPVMVVGGGRDLQVPASEAEVLHAANRSSQMVILPDMSHTLKDCALSDMMTQRQTVYIDSSLPLSEGLVEALRGFMGSLTQSK